MASNQSEKQLTGKHHRGYAVQKAEYDNFRKEKKEILSSVQETKEQLAANVKTNAPLIMQGLRSSCKS